MAVGWFTVVATGGVLRQVNEEAPTAPAAVHRIMQESLTNVTKHSGAGRVMVQLAYGDGEPALTVEDDGGYPRPARPGPSVAAGSSTWRNGRGHWATS